MIQSDIHISIISVLNNRSP